MSGVTFDHALDVVMQLSPEDREVLIDIVTRRESQARREEIAREAHASIEAYERGEFRTLSVEDAIQELHDYADEEE